MIERWTESRQAKSVAVLGNAADVFPDLVRRGVLPDLVTDQTSAHDPGNGYLAGGLDARRVAREAGERPVRGGSGGPRIDPNPRAGHGRLVEPRGADHRLRQQHPPGRERSRSRRRLLLPGVRAGVHPSPVLPRDRAVSLVRAVRRSGRHLPDRREGEGADSGRSAPPQLARHGAGAHQLPGAAGPHLLGGARAAAPARPRVQRDGGQR